MTDETVNHAELAAEAAAWHADHPGIEALYHADREHSELGASSADRWWNCPHSVIGSRGIPSIDSAQSREGTAGHELAQMCLTAGSGAWEYVGREIGGFTVDDEFASAVQVYLNAVREVWLGNTFTENRWIEYRVDLYPLNPPAAMFGTCDAAAYIPVARRLYIFDLKFGRGHRVEAEGNPQLRYYALGMMLALDPDAYPVNEVVMTIVQPRQPAAGRDPVRTVTMPAADLMAWAADLMVHARAAMEPDAPAKAGDWCFFCPKAGSCTTRATAALDVARLEFETVVDRDATVPALLDTRTITPEQLGALLPRLAMLEAWAKDARALAVREMLAGRDVPGWKLVEQEGREKWKDDAEAEALLAAAHEVDPFAPPKVLSPSQARHRIADRDYDAALDAWLLRGKPKGSKPTKKACEVVARRALDPQITRPRYAKLAQAADPRPALSGGASEFLALPDETVEED